MTQDHTQDQARASLYVDPAVLPQLQEVAALADAELTASARRLSDPASILLIIVVGAPLAVAAVVKAADELRGGQLIDLRPEAEMVIRRTRDVSYGLMVVLAPDGAVDIRVYQPDSMFKETVELIAGLIPSLVDTGSRQIAERVRAATAGTADVTLRSFESPKETP